MDNSARTIWNNLLYSNTPESAKAKFILSRLSAMTGRTQQWLIVKLVIEGFLSTKDAEVTKMRPTLMEEIKGQLENA